MTGLLLLVVLLGLVLLSLWAIVDSSLQPDRAWQQAGISRGLTTALLILTCAIGATVYFVLLRPRLRRAQGLDKGPDQGA